MPVLLCAAELFAAPQTLPLGGVNITACVRGSVVDIDRNGDRRTDGGAIDKIVVAGNDLALFVAQDGRSFAENRRIPSAPFDSTTSKMSYVGASEAASSATPLGSTALNSMRAGAVPFPVWSPK